MKKEEQQLFLKIVIVAVIVGVVAFVAGMKWQQSQSSLSASGNEFGRGNFAGRPGGMMGGNTQGRTGGARGGFRPVSGEIITSDDTSITVKLSDGGSRIVLLSGSTTINKAASGTRADLRIGEKVAIFGQENSDGSVTAQSIQLDPASIGMYRLSTPAASPKL